MVIFRLCVILIIISSIVYENNAVTHWVVTQSGRIQAYLDSPFDIRRPYDLFALLEQESRSNQINELYQDLINRKSVIEKKCADLKGVEKIYEQVQHCLSVMSDMDLYSNFAFNASVRANIKMHFNLEKKIRTYNVPDCLKYSTVDSSDRYENVPILQNQSNIFLQADDYLKQFMPVESVDLFGHEIASALSLNVSSWFHYNLATLFWRIKGDGGHSMRCIKRALQFVPREYRDVPLHNLAGILYQASYYKEAASFLHSALDHAPDVAVHYYALGKIYSKMEELNRSLTFFDKYIELIPDQKDVSNKHSVFCVLKLVKGLHNFEEFLQGILTDLHDYHSQQQQWLRLQERLNWEQSTFDVQLDNALHNRESGRRTQRCIQKTSENSKQIISCYFHNQRPDFETLNLQNLFHYVENEKKKINEHKSKSSHIYLGKKEPISEILSDIKIEEKINSNANENEDGIDIESPPILFPKFPTNFPTSSNQYFDVTGWPTKEECASWHLPVDEKDDLDLPVFLPPENKGYQVHKLLSDYISLSDGSQHELPWYPPVCEQPGIFGDKYLPPNKRHVINNEIKSNSFLRNFFLSYVNDGKADEAEIGQRIITAMDQKSAPKWVLATLASLYWRVRGNAKRALYCLDLALQIVPDDSADVVLDSISSVVHQLGFVDHAINFASLAFKINYVEPSTNFLLAVLHYSKNNPLLAMYYMKNVLRVDSGYYDGKAELLLKTWGCRIKSGTYNNVKQSKGPTEGMCAKKESIKGEGVICSPNGDHCKTAAIQCYQTNLVHEEGSAESKAKLETESEPCNVKHKLGLGQSLISTLIAADGYEDLIHDKLKFETSIQMRLSLGDEPVKNFDDIFTLGDTEPETLLYVYDEFGTYSLSTDRCKSLRVIHKFKYASVWPSIVPRSLDLTPYLDPLPEFYDINLQPYCKETKSVPIIGHLTSIILKHRLPGVPEEDLTEMLELMASDHKSTLNEFGVKLNLALKENTTSWILATASAMYWRIIGNTEQSIICVNLALANAPEDKQDIPLINLANLLNKIGYNSEALEVAFMALKVNRAFVLNHFTLGNILVSMGELERAISFYRICLALDSNFEPARHRLQVVLCSILFDDGTSRKPTEEFLNN